MGEGKRLAMLGAAILCAYMMSRGAEEAPPVSDAAGTAELRSVMAETVFSKEKSASPILAPASAH